jgi:single-strand DNA-binding protein
MGHLSDKVVVREAGSSHVANFRLGVNNGTKDQPLWTNVSCVVWGNKAKALAASAEKGDIIELAGAIHVRSYDNKKGEKVYVTEIKVGTINLTPTKKKVVEDDDFEAE